MAVIEIENFLDENLYHEVFETSKLIYENKNRKFTLTLSDSFHEDNFPILVHNVFPDSELYKKIETNIERKTNFCISDQKIMFYFWSKFSYMPWHEDSTHDALVSIHLSEDWDKNYGGYFLYKKTNDSIKCLIPRKNTGVFQKNPVKSCVTPINFSGNVRCTLQAFLKQRVND